MRQGTVTAQQREAKLPMKFPLYRYLRAYRVRNMFPFSPVSSYFMCVGTYWQIPLDSSRLIFL